MNQKFNAKKFLGKKRIYRPVSGATLISRVLVWDDDKSEYREPPRGTKYLARRAEVLEGQRKLVAQSFDTLEAAKNWQLRIVVPLREVQTQPRKAGKFFLRTGLFWRMVSRLWEWVGHCFVRLLMSGNLGHFLGYRRVHKSITKSI